MKNILSVIVVTVLLSSCSGKSETVVMPFENTEIFKPLLLEMGEKNIWYEEVGKNSIRVKIQDMQKVLGIAREIADEILPVGRSSAYNSEIQIRLKPALEERGINYKTVCFDGIEFLVWENNDTDTVKSLASTIQRNTKITSSHQVGCR